MPVSQNGWQASKDPRRIKVRSYTIPDTDVKVRLAAGAAPLLLEFARVFNAKVEKIEGPVLDDWGYNYRPVRGQEEVLSNHASGTALDLNAMKHPLWAKGTFNLKQRAILLYQCKRLGLRHGEFYKNRPDPMHVEIAVTPEKAAQIIAKLGLKA